MLPEELSTDLTSLLEAAERLVVVVDLVDRRRRQREGGERVSRAAS